MQSSYRFWFTLLAQGTLMAATFTMGCNNVFDHDPPRAFSITGSPNFDEGVPTATWPNRGIANSASEYYYFPMTTISLKIPDQLRAELEAEARRQRKAKSFIIREALAAGLQRTRKARKQSLYERARDLVQDCRCPRDLASNAKYLRGYGA